MAGVVALLGVGFIALPAGILAAGFVEELEEDHARGRALEKGSITCPRCGETLRAGEGVGGPLEEGDMSL